MFLWGLKKANPQFPHFLSGPISGSGHPDVFRDYLPPAYMWSSTFGTDGSNKHRPDRNLFLTVLTASRTRNLKGIFLLVCSHTGYGWCQICYHIVRAAWTHVFTLITVVTLLFLSPVFIFKKIQAFHHLHQIIFPLFSISCVPKFLFLNV